jgi:hypothetical protein
MLGMDLGLNIGFRLLDIFFPGYLKIPEFGVIVLDIFGVGGRSVEGMGWNLTLALSLVRRGDMKPHPSPLLGKAIL